MGWYQPGQKDPDQHRNHAESGGFTIFRWIVMAILAIGFIIVEAAAISAFGVIGIFVGLAVLVIVVCFFGSIFGNW